MTDHPNALAIAILALTLNITLWQYAGGDWSNISPKATIIFPGLLIVTTVGVMLWWYGEAQA